MTPLARKLARRLALSLVVLAGVSVLMFLIARIIPGDPARIALGPNATAEAVESLRDRLHLNEPLAVQYAIFVRDVFHGDLGVSLYTNRPVTTDIAEFLPATLELVFVAGALMILLGIPLGTLAARYQNRWPDHLLRLVSLLGVSTPAFVWAVVLMLFLSYFVPWFPVDGRIDEALRPEAVTGFLLIDTALAGDGRGFLSALHHIILPALALAASGIGQTARLTRANVVEAYRQPYVEMAQAYGFAERRIANRYALRPALIPALTILGLDFAAMLGNAFLVESVFSWPGLSRYGVQVILRKDLNAIVGTVLVISAFFLIINIIVDLLVSVINPRIRLAEGERR